MTTPERAARFVDDGGCQGFERIRWDAHMREPDGEVVHLGTVMADSKAEAHDTACERWPAVPAERLYVEEGSQG